MTVKKWKSWLILKVPLLNGNGSVLWIIIGHETRLLWSSHLEFCVFARRCIIAGDDHGFERS